VLAGLVHFCFGLPILAAFLIYYRVPLVAADLLWFPLIVLIQLVLTLGLALLVSAVTVHFRDVRDLLSNLLTLWFFATPIIYYWKFAPDTIRRFLDANPFTHLAISYQEILYFPGDFGHWKWLLALGVGLTVALGGVTTSAAAYLLGEVALRPVVSRALSSHAPERRGVPGVATRWLLAWALGTGVPIVGLLLVAIVALTPVPISQHAFVITTLALCSIGLVFGALVSLLAAYLTVHPLGAIRRALARVREGDLDTELKVWDGTEMGLLQAGFNEMAAGLRERERIRDLFGRQVGEEAARQALEDGVRLGGELREVAVLFVDVVGSTELAAARPPQEVVALLNRFFAEVVDVVDAHGGWIDKFPGDAALAVFGAPLAIEDPAGCALRAARALRSRLRERVPELDAGIGIAAGPVVAGHLGAERRFEYTVIGDPVNEASRLTDLAKQDDGRVLASGEALVRAGAEEAARWEVGEEAVLRGRTLATRLARPA